MNMFRSAVLVCLVIGFVSIVTNAAPLMSATAVQTILGSTPMFKLLGNGFTLDELAQDVDVIYYHIEHYGVPWELFRETSTPFDYWDWTKDLQAYAAAYEPYRGTKPLMLGTVMTRESLAAKAELGLEGSLDLKTDWAEPCLDVSFYNGYDHAYSVYIQWIVRTFKPKYLNLGVEINAYIEKCGTLNWNATVDMYNRAYDMANKTALELGYQIIAFPSFILDQMYDSKLTGYNQTKWDMLLQLKRDRLAISTYPQGTASNDANNIPNDYFTRLADIKGETLIIGESGWNSEDIVTLATNCLPFLPGSESMQATFLQRMGELAASAEVIVWWSSRDLLPNFAMTNCYNETCGDDIWCQYVQIFRELLGPTLGDLYWKIFGAMGFRDYDGNIKEETYAVWNSLRGTENTPANPNPSANPNPTANPTSIPTKTNGSYLLGSAPWSLLLVLFLFVLIAL